MHANIEITAAVGGKTSVIMVGDQRSYSFLNQ